MRGEKLFAGARIRGVREQLGLSQRNFAARLGLSISYLSQMEADLRPVTVGVLMSLGREYGVDIREFAQDRTTRLVSDLREVFADPILADAPPSLQDLKRTIANAPAVAHSLVRVHKAYREQQERLQAMDEAINADRPDGHLLPWEEARDYFHYRDNYIDPLDRAAEQLSVPEGDMSAVTNIEQLLATRHGVNIGYLSGDAIRRYDPVSRTLLLHPSLEPESRAFQLAHQLSLLELGSQIDRLVTDAKLRSGDTRQIVRVGLANYAAGAFLMPYARFAARAHEVRHDIEQLRRAFGVSFEQACHRLSTLQRPGARGVPFFFVRVDMAGNITKRHSATRLQFARYGGACPLWIVHEAVALPSQIMIQRAEMPDGSRFVCMAQGLVKGSGRFVSRDRRYAVALGCEETYAQSFIYADKLAGTGATPIGTSCRICPRSECTQRAFPPSDRRTIVDVNDRTVVPYRFD